jgi:YfiR/HmsC-like
MRRGLFRMYLVSCLGLAQGFIPQVAMGQQDSAGEYELKAAMLYNLTRFVEWPPSAYADPQAPTVLCILGRDPFGDSLASLAGNQNTEGRPMQIRHVSKDKGFRGCHVVYISSSERKSMATILSTLKGSSVLTVGEMAQFASRGGMLQFSLEEKQVHFEINLDATSAADLRISSRLLVLARIVKEQNKNQGREGSALRSQEFEVVSAWPPGRQNEPKQNSLTAVVSNESDELRRNG